jgi:transposase-like protein
MDKNSNSNSNPPDAGQDFQRWTAKRKSAVVLEIIKGLTTAAEVARKYGLTVAEVERWVDAGLHALESGLRSNPKEAAEEWESEKKDLFAKIGQLSLEVDVLKKVQGLGRRDSEDEN